MDAIETLADEQLLLLATDLQVQLERKTAQGYRPVLVLLAEARQRAGKALLILALDTDAEDTAKIRKLQAEIAVYDDMVTACQRLIAAGKEARSRIKESERIALDEVIVNMTDDERRLHGFETRGQD